MFFGAVFLVTSCCQRAVAVKSDRSCNSHGAGSSAPTLRKLKGSGVCSVGVRCGGNGRVE